MFGQTDQVPQNEETSFNPMSPYACGKVFSHYVVKNYRAAYGMHATNGILFNHESPRRGETFVTRKITRGLARILAGIDEKLYLGNLEAKRDWGYAGDYVEAMWLMLQQDVPDDYVIATGETHSVKEFLAEAFGAVGLDWQEYVEVDERYLRPSEVEVLLGDASKARDVLNWQPKTTFKELIRMLLRNDLDAVGLAGEYDF
jgi:GDPmannose 4,6-dehydratase